MRRTLYWKRLLIVLAVFLGLGGTVFAVHHFQVKSQSGALRDRAYRAADAAETDPSKRPEAIAHLKAYLRAKRTDEAAYQRYAALWFAEVKADPAQTERAAAGVEEFLREFPNHPEERLKLADLYVATGQSSKLLLARQHLEMVFAASGGAFKTNIEARESAATCEQALGNLPGAIAHTEAALATGTAPVRVYQRAMSLHYANRRTEAKWNTYVDDYLRALRSGRFADDLAARVAAARFEMMLGNVVPARADMKEAMERLKGGEDADALLAMAELELQAIKTIEEAVAQHAKAEVHLRKAFAIDKKNVPVGIVLAEVLYRQGKRDDGIAFLKQTADALGEVNDLYLMLVDRLIDLGEQELSLKLVDKLGTDANRKSLVTYYRGRLAVVKEDWMNAVKLLDETAPHMVRAKEFHKRAMVGLAACYAAMQNPDKQLEYCRAALRDDERYPIAIIGEAEALSKMGKHADALHRFRVIVHKLQVASYRSELARLELYDVMLHPVPAERNWTRFEEALGPVAGRAPELYAMHAESLVARGNTEGAAKLLNDWLAANPADPKAATVWVALTRVNAGGTAESAGKVLDDAEKKLGSTVDIRLARAALLVARARPTTAADFDALATGTEKWTDPDRYKLHLGLGQSAGRAADRKGDTEEGKTLRAAALKHLRAAADVTPRDLVCRAALLDQGLAAGRPDVVAQALKEMATVEGDDGPVGSLGRIAIGLPEVRKINDPDARALGIRNLRKFAENVEKMRPGWSRVFIALGQLDEIEGLNDKALENYVTAIERGERQEFVIRRAIDMCRVKRQDDRARGLLNRLSTETRLPDDLERYRSIHNMLAAELPAKEKPTVDRIAPADSKDYRILLLRGSLLAAIRDDAGALQAFRDAVGAPGGVKVPGEPPIPHGHEVPETWIALVGQLVKSDPKLAAKAVEQADAALKKLTPKSDAEKAELLVALGGLYELIGDLKTAHGHLVAAQQLAKLELNPNRQLVEFYQRTGQGDGAKKLLEEATGSVARDVQRWARRHLAITLIAGTDAYVQRERALTLIKQNLDAPDARSDAEDRKAQATIQTVDPVTRDEGIRTLREYGARNDLTPHEYYLLGRLSFDSGDYAKSVDHFLLGARVRPGVTAEHMAGPVRAYLALGRLYLAETALDRLKHHNSTSWEATREEARVLYRKSKAKTALAEFDDAKKLKDQARAVILKFRDWDAPANLTSKSGPLFDEVGLLPDAEAAYKKFMDGSQLPYAHWPLAVFYVRHKQADKAIELARAREKTSPVLVTAQVFTAAVQAKRQDATTEAAIAAWIDDSLSRAAGKPEVEAGLIGARAELFDAQGDYTKAIAEYDRALTKHKSDRVVNNLCMLLALTAGDPDRKANPRLDEAEKLMTDLIGIRGPVPGYLDTRAVVYITKGQPDKAFKDLKMAQVQSERAVYHYHLAWALDLDREAAKAAQMFPIDQLKKAKALELTAADLHKKEYTRYTEMMQKYLLPIDEK